MLTETLRNHIQNLFLIQSEVLTWNGFIAIISVFNNNYEHAITSWDNSVINQVKTVFIMSHKRLEWIYTLRLPKCQELLT